MEDDGAERRAAHPRVGDAHHVRHARREELARDRDLTPLGHARAALRAAVAKHEHGFRRHVECGIVDARGDVVDVLEHERGAAVAEQARRGRAPLDEGAGGGEAAAHHRDRAGRPERRVERRDHVAVERLGGGEPVRERLAGHGQRLAVEERRELLQHGGDTAGAVQLLDEVLAGRPHVDEERRLRGDLAEAVERQRDADAAREREQVHDGVRPAADRGEQRDGVVERLGGEDLPRRQPLHRQLDRATTRRLGGARPRGADGGDRRGARQ